MSKAKESMIFYYDWVPLLETFSPEIAIEIIFSLVHLDKDGTEPQLSFKHPLEQAVYDNMVKAVRKNRAAYLAKCGINKENGAKGGRPKQDAETKKPNGYDKNQKKPNGYDKKTENHDKDNDKDNDWDNENDADADADVLQKASASIRELYPDNLNEITALWNQQEVTQNIRNIPILGRRMENTRLCLNQAGSYDELLNVIRSLDGQAWFRKQAETGKKLSFDWFVDPNNFQKVLEGNYTEERGTKDKEGMVWL